MTPLEELTADIREKLPRLMYITTLDFTYYKCKAKKYHDPMLNDVLEWYKNSQYENGVNVMHELLWTQTSEHILKLWDLSKPYLKDQSPELISYLHSLIKTKQ